MTAREPTKYRAAIACGGTGGHLFPGLAVAEELRRRDCAVTLLISPKEVDQEAVKSARDVSIETLPAVGLTRGDLPGFVRGFASSFHKSRKAFKASPPDAVLAMGGFTSAPPALVGKMLRSAIFLHESNAVPGRANRLLSWLADHAFVGFPETTGRLHTLTSTATGTPVRSQFVPANAAECRTALGLDPQRPVLLVTGGSQGASALNDLIVGALPRLTRLVPSLQLLHLAGSRDVAKIKLACQVAKVSAVVHPFLAEMHLALGAATVAVSRAGASSLAELAAMRVPAILVPYPAATHNHQYFNATAYLNTGAARLTEQRTADPEKLAYEIAELLQDSDEREKMRAALHGWHSPRAASQIAETILQTVANRRTASAAAHAVEIQARQNAIS